MVLYLVAAQAFHNFTLCPRGIRSSVEFCDTLCTSKLRAAKYEEPTIVNFDLELPELRSFRTPENFFSPTFELQSALIELTIFAEWTKSQVFVRFCSEI